MDEKTNDHIAQEQATHTTEHMHKTSKEQLEQRIEEIEDSQPAGDAKVEQVNVLSVALTDALVKDNISPWCPSMLKLYLILLLVTLSWCQQRSLASARITRSQDSMGRPTAAGR